MPECVPKLCLVGVLAFGQSAHDEGCVGSMELHEMRSQLLPAGQDIDALEAMGFAAKKMDQCLAVEVKVEVCSPVPDKSLQVLDEPLAVGGDGLPAGVSHPGMASIVPGERIPFQFSLHFRAAKVQQFHATYILEHRVVQTLSDMRGHKSIDDL